MSIYTVQATTAPGAATDPEAVLEALDNATPALAPAVSVDPADRVSATFQVNAASVGDAARMGSEALAGSARAIVERVAVRLGEADALEAVA